jgi:hypothetical protein
MVFSFLAGQKIIQIEPKIQASLTEVGVSCGGKKYFWRKISNYFAEELMEQGQLKNIFWGSTQTYLRGGYFQ